MENLIVKEFNGSQIYTFMWKEKSCWIANQIVGLFDYADVSKTIQDCIKAEDFEIEQEYDVLKGNEFNDFVTTLNVVANNIISNKARSITKMVCMDFYNTQINQLVYSLENGLDEKFYQA